MRLSLILVGPLVICFALGSLSQDQPPAISTAKPKVFEIVSIKPSKPGTEANSMEDLPNGFRDTNSPLEGLVEGAYGMMNGDHVLGMPSWAKSEPYDVDARVDAATADAWKNLTEKERFTQEQQMLQAMLVDRCKLKVHFETKELPAYDLVIAKSGLKMKEASPDENSTESFTRGKLAGRAMGIGSLIAVLPKDGRLLVDKTGLVGKKFDIDLQWTPDDHRTEADSGPSVFTALEEQLGLKLVSSKTIGKVLVIDHMEKPSPN